MKLVYSPKYEVDIGPHVFQTRKYRLVRERLLRERLVKEADFIEPSPATLEQLKLVHSHEYLQDLEALRWTDRTRFSELPLTEDIVDAYVLAAGGTVLGARLALEGLEKVCVHIGGGFHHAFADHAEGFCYINDIAVAIRVLQHEGRIRRALVVDCDLHQGNGTAKIFESDPDVFTLSIHQENNYPLKERSDLDIGLEDFAGDTEYLDRLEDGLSYAFAHHTPEFMVFVAGVDPYYKDQLGALKLTMEGMRQRDELVLGEAKKRNIPLVVVFAGGYTPSLDELVELHTQTCRVALRLTQEDKTASRENDS